VDRADRLVFSADQKQHGEEFRRWKTRRYFLVTKQLFDMCDELDLERPTAKIDTTAFMF
jgi:hypothetical protein